SCRSLCHRAPSPTISTPCGHGSQPSWTRPNSYRSIASGSAAAGQTCANSRASSCVPDAGSGPPPSNPSRTESRLPDGSPVNGGKPSILSCWLKPGRGVPMRNSTTTAFAALMMVIVPLCGAVAATALEEGVAAFDRNDFAAALRLLGPLADKEEP